MHRSPEDQLEHISMVVDELRRAFRSGKAQLATSCWEAEQRAIRAEEQAQENARGKHEYACRLSAAQLRIEKLRAAARGAALHLSAAGRDSAAKALRDIAEED